MRQATSREVCRFLGDARERAGGSEPLTRHLAEMGFVGVDGPFGEATVRAWIAGRRSPDPAVLLAVAAYYGLSLDEYAFGPQIRRALIETTGRNTQPEGSA